VERLINKVAVVTGAARGIGAAIAKALAAEGAAVAINYASSKQQAEQVIPGAIEFIRIFRGPKRRTAHAEFAE
jgi:3-oxoacyl-[acyl-carrier protein] reductase